MTLKITCGVTPIALHTAFHQVNPSVHQVNLKAVLPQISFDPEIKKKIKE